MPSSPEPAVLRWQPDELGAAEAPTEPVAERLALFELHESAGIPPVVLEPARKAAEAAGYAAGWALGTRAAQLEAEGRAAAIRNEAEQALARDQARLASAHQTLTSAARAAADLAVPALSQIEQLIVTTAFEIAEAVVGATLRDDPRRGATAVTRALALVPAGLPTVVAVSPADHGVLDPHELGPDITLVLDPDLAPGDAVATSGATSVDARISVGLARVRELLASV